jgi:hypothetical protein
MRTTLLLILFAFPALALLACSCVFEEINEATFNDYSFIAHIKVTKVEEMNGPFESGVSYWFDDPQLISFTVMQLYRGEAFSFAIETDHSSSCGTFIREGEEWIIYAFPDKFGQLNIVGCTPSSTYRYSGGIKELSYGYPTRLKDWLDAHCGILPEGVTEIGPSQHIHRYSSSQLEEHTEYFDGLRHGNSVQYYPSGILMDERHYYRGEPIGLRRYYKEDGTPSFELEYNFQGELVRETNYSKAYDDLRHEIIYVPEIDLQKDFAYRADGTPAKMIMTRDWNPLEEKYFDSSGSLIHHLMFYQEGIATVMLDSLADRR